MSDTESSGPKPLLQPDIQVLEILDSFRAEEVIRHTCNAVEQTVLPAKSKGKPCAFSIQITDSNTVQQLNKQYRQKDMPTNVLSFENEEGVEAQFLPFVMLGDIIISKDVLQKEAVEKNIPTQNHLAHLVTHGLLHLYGLDHLEETEAEIMEDAEIRILSSMDINNPYCLVS